MLKMIKKVLTKKGAKPACLIPSIVASKNTKGICGGPMFEMNCWVRR